MKILVVDDDIVARKVLGAFLKQSNYEMEIVEGGLSAFRVMTAPNAPRIAIIDWLMPDLSGPELCTRLRAHAFEIQPYLIMLSSRKEKSDIVAALDAGADDFISKPFNIQETQARLRAGERWIERQLALWRRIQELEKAAPRRGAGAKPAPSAALAPTVPVPALEDHQIDTLVTGALAHCGVGHEPRRIATASAVAPVAWASLLLPKEELWLDLVLEAGTSGLSDLFTHTRGRPAGRLDDLSRFCGEIQTAFRDALRSLLRSIGSTVLEVLPPQTGLALDPSCPTPPPELTRSHHYKVGSATLSFVVAAQPSPLQQKTTQHLRLFDVLAAAYPPAADDQVPFMRAGVALNEHFIEKLHGFAHASEDPPPVPVHSPSALALHYQRIGYATAG